MWKGKDLSSLLLVLWLLWHLLPVVEIWPGWQTLLLPSLVHLEGPASGLPPFVFWLILEQLRILDQILRSTGTSFVPTSTVAVNSRFPLMPTCVRVLQRWHRQERDDSMCRLRMSCQAVLLYSSSSAVEDDLFFGQRLGGPFIKMQF